MNIVSHGNGHHHYLGIHGWGGGHPTFEPLLPYLPDVATLHAVDMPGYGTSDPPAEWSLERVTERLVAAIDRMPEAKLTLVGNCSGALYGLSAALHRRERFERLVLLDPFAYFPWYFRMLLWPVVGRLFYMASFHNPVGRWLTNAGLRGHRTEKTHLTQSFRELRPSVVYEYLRMLREIPGAESFEPLKMPVDIVFGENTFGAVRRSVEIWKDVWPHARTFELEGAAHLPIQEATEQLAAIIWAGRPEHGALDDDHYRAACF